MKKLLLALLLLPFFAVAQDCTPTLPAGYVAIGTSNIYQKVTSGDTTYVVGNSIAKYCKIVLTHQLRDSLLRYTPQTDRLLSGGTPTTNSTSNFVIAAATYYLTAATTNPVSSSSRTFSSVPLALSGNQKFVAVFGNTSGTLDTLSGPEVVDNPQLPATPANKVFITYFQVTSSTITAINQPAPSSNAIFNQITQQTGANFNIDGSGILNKLRFTPTFTGLGTSNGPLSVNRSLTNITGIYNSFDDITNVSNTATPANTLNSYRSTYTINASNTQNIGGLRGFVSNHVITSGATGTLANWIGATSFFQAAAMTTTTATGMSSAIVGNAGSTITNAIGINALISGTGTITNKSFLLLGTGTAPSGNYGIYDATTYPSLFSSSVTAGSFVKSGGLATEYLMADGSVTTGGGGSGTVTSVSSANADIGVATGTTTPVLTLNSSTSATASTIVKRNGSGDITAAAVTGTVGAFSSNIVNTPATYSTGGKNYVVENATNHNYQSVSSIPQADVTNLVSDLASKVGSASPTFTGTATFADVTFAPSAVTGSSSTVSANLPVTWNTTGLPAAWNLAITDTNNGAPTGNGLTQSADALRMSFSSGSFTKFGKGTGGNPFWAISGAAGSAHGPGLFIYNTGNTESKLIAEMDITGRPQITFGDGSSIDWKLTRTSAATATVTGNLTVSNTILTGGFTSANTVLWGDGTSTRGRLTYTSVGGNAAMTSVASAGLDLYTDNASKLALNFASTGIATSGFKHIFAASTTSNASVNIPQGTAPTSPNNGDQWNTSVAQFHRINSSTKQVAYITDGTGYTVDPTTSALSAANLNSAYGSVSVGYRVICKDITGAPAIYTKVTEAGGSDVWVTAAVTITP